MREIVEQGAARDSRSADTRRFEGIEEVATEKVDACPTTRPPPRFNEATLLSAMEGAGKSIEDDELREAMREKGLGTPATRAQIIEGLIFERYILREGKELIATPKAASLMTLLHGLGIPELFSPELTAEWEFKLAQMEHGQLKRASSCARSSAMTKHIVAQAKNYESDTIPGDFATLSARCPKCGGEVHEKYKRFQCVACDFGFWKIMGGRQIEPGEADTLLTTREVGPLDGFRSRIGRPFSAKLKLTEANDVEFDFGPRADADDGPPPDFSAQTPLGPCPKCGNRVFETPNAYVCERAVGEGRTCDFRSGRMILQRPIEPAQMSKLLEQAKPICCSSFRRARAGRSRLFSSTSRTARSGSSSRRRNPAGKARVARRPLRCACSSIRANRSPSNCTPDATAHVGQARQTNATLPRPRQSRLADTRRSGRRSSTKRPDAVLRVDRDGPWVRARRARRRR